jgi:hypothetical protein
MTVDRRRALVWALRAAIVLALTEGTSLLAIRLSQPFLAEQIRTTGEVLEEQSERIRLLIQTDSTRMLAVDSLLGWRYRAGHRDSANTISAQGLRTTRSYATRPPPGTVRVAAFGDSFVYGSEVVDSAAWPAIVERLTPQLEVLNYGVGGYGVDQAYLRFCLEGTALAPQIVIVGFTPDDLRRVVNVYRRFISNREFPLVKPRFTLTRQGDLVLLPSPVPTASDYERYLRAPQDIFRLGADDYWYHPLVYTNPLYDYSATVRLLTNAWLRVAERYFRPDRMVRRGVFNSSSAAYRIQLALFERFATAARAMGARPIVLLLPDRESVAQARAGRPTVLTPLIHDLGVRGLDYIDLTPMFADSSPTKDVNSWFMGGGHYSPAGNRLVAERLGRDLLALEPVATSDRVQAIRDPLAPWHGCPRTAVRRPMIRAVSHRLQ